MKRKKTAKSKKPLSPQRFRKEERRRAKRAAADAKKRTASYSKGDRLVKQVAKTLHTVAKTHPSPKARKQAKLAIKQLHQAQNAFGDTSTCAAGPSGPP